MIAKLPFGKTGHASTRSLFGGAAITEGLTQKKADRLLDLLLEQGVNHIDTAPLYGNGNSEARIGAWMKSHRDQFFLATKNRERTHREAWHSIRTSLKRLQVDYVDMIQLHNLTDPREWELALGPEGALSACVEAREKGLVRFIGVTGHGLRAPVMLRKSLERYAFDAVLLPWNYLLSRDTAYAAAFFRLTALCAERLVAVQTIKSIACRPWEGRTRTATTWYEPLTSSDDVQRAVSWVLSHEGIFLNTASDALILPLILEAASQPAFRPTDGEMEAMAAARDMLPIFSGGSMIF